MLSIFKNSEIYRFFGYLITFRQLIWSMVIHEIRTRYVGSIGGVLWVVVHPLVLAGIYWLVFSVGFKVHPQGEVPFILFFLCGLAPWLTFQETMTNAVDSVIRSPHLVKKVVFPLGALPVVSLFVGLVTQVIMVLVLLALLTYYGFSWSWTMLGGFYYLFALLVFILGFSWLVSSLNVFFRDISHGLTVGLGMWFWLTPIVWPLELLPVQFRDWLSLNPMYYIVEGFRDSFLHGIPVWESANNHLAFWLVAAPLFWFGARVFKRLRNDFAEVL